MKGTMFLPMLLFSFGYSMAQNVGIGTNSPTARLHVNGPIKLEGTNLFEFGAGVVGKEVNAGKIGYNAFGQNALTFIGAGTSNSNRAVYFYAEGGTTFNGPINVGGTLQLNGNPGVSGQILTSNGSSDPSWQNAAFTDKTRFAVLFSKNTGSANGDAVMGVIQYNLNPANVTIGSSTITINKSGLYHFDINMGASIAYTATPAAYPQQELWFYFGPANPFTIINKKLSQYAPTANPSWVGQEMVSIELHISAPATLHLYHKVGEFLAGTVSSYSVNGFINGHLVNE